MTFAPRTWAHLHDAARAHLWASLALRHISGLGARSWTRLVRHFGSALDAVRQISRWSEAQIPANVAARAASGAWRASALQEWQALQQQPCTHIILWNDPDYPPVLRQLPDAPLLLYCRGDISLLSAPALAVVGSRHCTAEGVRVAGSIARQLSASGITIISGMARGIDAVAHAVALRGIGRSIGVLGTGIDVMYPPENMEMFEHMEERGLLLTEFAPGTQPVSSNFPVRNRIISGLSLGVLVVEATQRSGSLITARLALEQNREVYAIPGPTSAAASLGCQELVRQGAHPVFSAEDILRDMAPLLRAYGLEQEIALARMKVLDADAPEETTTTAQPPLPPSPASAAKDPAQAPASPTARAVAPAVAAAPIPKDMDEDAAAVLRALDTTAPMHTDAICLSAALAPFRVSVLLTELEVGGYVRRHAGARYTRVAGGRHA